MYWILIISIYLEMEEQKDWLKAKVGMIVMIILLSILLIILLRSTFSFYKFYKFKSKCLLCFFWMLICEIIWRITTFSLYLSEYYEDWRRNHQDLADNLYSYSGLAFMWSAVTFHLFSWLYSVIEINYFLDSRKLLLADLWLAFVQIFIISTYSIAFTIFKIKNIIYCSFICGIKYCKNLYQIPSSMATNKKIVYGVERIFLINNKSEAN